MRNNIKRYRLEQGLLQRELAEILRVHKSILGMWEMGTRDPSPAQQIDIAVALECPVKTIFPDFVAAEPVRMNKGADRREISTMGGLRQTARISKGEKMLVRLANVAGEGSTFVPGTVVQITPSWFRVKLDKSGYSTCVHYQAFLTENDVRRLKK